SIHDKTLYRLVISISIFFRKNKNFIAPFRGLNSYDLFILTHPDDDHCHGFEKHFYTGKPNNYSDKDKGENKILIDEMWVTKLIYGEVCSDAETIREEVKRRRKLYDSTDRSNETPYNRLSMIGYDTDATFGNCPYHIPGDLVKDFVGITHTNLEIFIHSPFKKSLIEAQAKNDRNASSIVCQYKLKRDDSNAYFNLLEGGDADHYRWKTIKEKSKKHNNLDRLEYDVMLAPHHCSWTFYNDVSYDDHPDPQETSKEIIRDFRDKNDKSYIVASCKEILDNNDNPPHHPAKKEYIKDLGDKKRFICTAEYPTKADPKPIQFELNSYKWVKSEDSNSRTTQKAATAYAMHTKASSYGEEY
ncbi:MAG: hypothetical protein AAFO82_23415, partial [Bacteroidota bacterium]